MDISFNNHFLNQIIYFSIQNTKFLKRIRSKFPIALFKTRERKFIAQIIFDYFDTYKQAIGQDFYNEFKEQEENLSKDMYDRCINLIGIIKDITGNNWQYIDDKINEAIHYYRLEEASVEFAQLIKNKKYNEAKSTILKAMKTTEYGVEESYKDFFEDKGYIEERLQEKRYKMASLIPSLDKTIGGFEEEMLTIFLGSSGSGKSWSLIETAISAVQQGLNVLFVSLEMGHKLIKERFDQTIGFMSSKKFADEQKRVVFKNNKWVKQKTTIGKTIFDIQEVEKNTRRLKKMGGGLKIMAFNQGQVNYKDIDRTLDELEQKEGFIADVLIVDYLGIMKPTEEGQNKKERISDNCLGLKNMAGTRNLIVFSAMQGNRSAMQAETFHAHMVADDIDTIFHSDLVLAICQSKKEALENKFRLYLAKNRRGIQHVSIGLIKELIIGQFALGEYDVSSFNRPKEDIPESVTESTNLY